MQKKFSFYVNSKDSKGQIFLFFILFFYLIFGLYIRFETLDLWRFNEWLTRDFDRAFNLVDGSYIPLAGPETSGGGRLPGPFLYFLLAIPLLINYSYESIYIFSLLLNITFMVIFYWINKKYFGLGVAVLAVILISINLLHVDMIAFPINPVFMYPLTIIFLGLMLEFAENKNGLNFILMFLVVTLAIQIHYSAATYYFIPLVVALFLRIKVSLRTILTTTAVVAVCLLPYLFYKINTLEPDIEIGEKIFHHNVPTLSEILKIPLVQNTINRITFREGAETIFTSPPIYTIINYAFLSLSFYGLVFLVTLNSFKGRFKYYRKEFALLLLFYIPALTYEITTPIKSHTWYTYIFLGSTVSISSIFLFNLYKIANGRAGILGFLSALVISFFLGYQTLSSYNLFTVVKNNIKRRMDLGNPGLEYKNLDPYKDFIRFIFRELRLSPEEYFSRVYFEDFSPYSLRLLKFSSRKNNISTAGNFKRKVRNCYYIPTNPLINFAKKRSGPLNNQKLEDFFNDKSIDIDYSKTRILAYKREQIVKVFKVFEYTPRAKQACYQNSSNIFFTFKGTRDLLIDSYGLKKSGKNVAVNNLSIQHEYNNRLELESFEGSYLIYDKKLQTPFKIKLSLNKKDHKYHLRVDLELYSYVVNSRNLFNLKKLEIVFAPDQNLKNSSEKNGSLQVIPPNSWISKHTPRSAYTNKLTWYREGILPTELILKEKTFRINITWKAEFPFTDVPYYYSNKMSLDLSE